VGIVDGTLVSVKSLLASAEDRTSFVVDLADCALYGFL